MKPLLFFAFVFGYVSAASAENLFTQENLWKTCHYYDVEKEEFIKEECEPSSIKIASCENNICFFQAKFVYEPGRWMAECHIWGKMTVLSDTYAQGKGIAEYRERDMEGDRVFEDCELNFKITGETMKITITSGCSKRCKPIPEVYDPHIYLYSFEFNKPYRIDNTGLEP